LTTIRWLQPANRWTERQNARADLPREKRC